MENKSRAFVLGIFIVVGLAILATGIFLIGDKQFLFSSTYLLKAAFPNVDGLNKGGDVRVGGLRVGTVDQIDLPIPPGRKVTVVMKLHDSTLPIIRKDSVAAIKTEGILGDKYLDISLGSKDAETANDGDVIHAEPTVNVADVANSIALETKASLAVFQEDMQALKQNFLLRGFFDKRGYTDSGDLTKHAINRLPAKSATKEFSYETKQLFGKLDNAKLKNQKELDEAGEFLQQNNFGTVVVVASGATVGDSDRDLELTRAQAMATRDYLVQNFTVDDTRIKTMGLGKAKKQEDSSKVKILVYSSRGGK